MNPRPSMELRNTILWIHALAGGAWVTACVCFVIAGLAIAAGSEEQMNFALRAAPRIDGFNVAAAIIVLATGGFNLALAGVARGFNFSAQFGIILAVKVLLFIAMTLALGRALSITTTLRAVAGHSRAAAVPVATTRTVRWHGAVAAMGAIALLCGLWLMGS
ncbi:MAG TPA: hypothetical protein VMV13_07140 [Candidatus Binataceae bacterium]|nr:hypothetical protein [Candidatus Binataceae bacterium]